MDGRVLTAVSLLGLVAAAAARGGSHGIVRRAQPAPLEWEPIDDGLVLRAPEGMWHAVHEGYSTLDNSPRYFIRPPDSVRKTFFATTKGGVYSSLADACRAADEWRAGPGTQEPARSIIAAWRARHGLHGSRGVVRGGRRQAVPDRYVVLKVPYDGDHTCFVAFDREDGHVYREVSGAARTLGDYDTAANLVRSLNRFPPHSDWVSPPMDKPNGPLRRRRLEVNRFDRAARQADGWTAP